MNRSCGLALALAVAAGCGAPPQADRIACGRRTVLCMDTVIDLTAYGPPERVERALDGATAELQRLAALLDCHLPGSAVSAFNARAGQAPTTVPPELADVLGISARYFRLTGGRHDPSVGPLTAAYVLNKAAPRIPSDAEVARLLPLVGWDRAVRMERPGAAESLSAGLAATGQALDLGGVAKGYVVDRCLGVLRRAGMDSALVNAGGDLATFGRKPDGSLFRVGVQDPDDRELLRGILRVADGAVATSGDYERFVVVDGRRYHHILDPTTGRPPCLARSATVVASDVQSAEPLATALIVAGPVAGLALVAGLPGVEASVIASDGTVHDTPGFGAYREGTSP